MSNTKTKAQKRIVDPAATGADPLAPTSNLPFAARACDMPYLDAIEGGSRMAINGMIQRGCIGPEVTFAELSNERTRQLGGWVDALKTAEDHLQWAHRGGSPAGLSASLCFDRARSLLSLAVGAMELMALNAAYELDDFCKEMPAPGTAFSVAVMKHAERPEASI